MGTWRSKLYPQLQVRKKYVWHRHGGGYGEGGKQVELCHFIYLFGHLIFFGHKINKIHFIYLFFGSMRDLVH